MPSLAFTVPGDPIGYVRTTRRQKFVDERWKRYQTWKNRVTESAGRQVLAIVGALEARKARVTMALGIHYRSDARRPDPDNVWKGIADALFKQDRNVVGSFDFAFDAEAPRVEVKITWEGK
jgi:Holliday junction resolvase RusA-like endonuclease